MEERNCLSLILCCGIMSGMLIRIAQKAKEQNATEIFNDIEKAKDSLLPLCLAASKNDLDKMADIIYNYGDI